MATSANKNSEDCQQWGFPFGTINVSTNEELQSLYKSLECPVCHEFPEPGSIFSCAEKRHMICEKCLPASKKCPVCSTPISASRCEPAEKCIADFLTPCKFKFDGCPHLLRGKDVRVHVSSCLYRPMICIMPKCQDEVPFKELFKHLTSVHENKINGTIDSSKHLIEWWIEGDISATARWPPFYFTCFDNVFLYMSVSTLHGMWEWVWILANEEEAKRFRFEAKMENLEKDLSVHFKGPVHSIRKPMKEVIASGQVFVTNSKEICNPFIFRKGRTNKSFWRTDAQIYQVSPPLPTSMPYVVTNESNKAVVTKDNGSKAKPLPNTKVESGEEKQTKVSNELNAKDRPKRATGGRLINDGTGRQFPNDVTKPPVSNEPANQNLSNGIRPTLENDTMNRPQSLDVSEPQRPLDANGQPQPLDTSGLQQPNDAKRRSKPLKPLELNKGQQTLGRNGGPQSLDSNETPQPLDTDSNGRQKKVDANRRSQPLESNEGPQTIGMNGRPQSLDSNEAPQPLETTGRQKPNNTNRRSQPPESNKGPENLDRSGRPQSLDNDERSPSIGRNGRYPTLDNDERPQTQPLGRNGRPQSLEGNEPPQPLNRKVRPQSLEGNDPPQPLNTNGRPQSLDGNERPQPLYPNGRPQPQRPQPLDSNYISQPLDPNGRPQPFDTKGRQPLDPSLPPDVMGRSQPPEKIRRQLPPEALESPLPPEARRRPQPSETVGRPLPPEAMGPPQPPETIARPLPPEAIRRQQPPDKKGMQLSGTVTNPYPTNLTFGGQPNNDVGQIGDRDTNQKIQNDRLNRFPVPAGLSPGEINQTAVDSEYSLRLDGGISLPQTSISDTGNPLFSTAITQTDTPVPKRNSDRNK